MRNLIVDHAARYHVKLGAALSGLALHLRQRDGLAGLGIDHQRLIRQSLMLLQLVSTAEAGQVRGIAGLMPTTAYVTGKQRRGFLRLTYAAAHIASLAAQGGIAVEPHQRRGADAIPGLVARGPDGPARAPQRADPMPRLISDLTLDHAAMSPAPCGDAARHDAGEALIRPARLAQDCICRERTLTLCGGAKVSDRTTGVSANTNPVDT